MPKVEGYLKLWRCSLDSRVWQNVGLWQTWCWCLMKASYKDRWVSIKTGKGDTEVPLKPGQFVFGRKTAAKELKVNTSTIRNRMAKLKSMGNVDIQPTAHYSIVSICNWESFQSEENVTQTVIGQARDNQRTTKGQPEDTNNKVKKEKKVKKDTLCPKDFPVTTEMLEYASSKKYHKDIAGLTEGFLIYHKSKGNKFTCWFSAWQTWLRNDIKFNGAGDSQWK